MNRKRHWYHISSTLTERRYTLAPSDYGPNRGYDEPTVARICVAPTIEQCLAAVPYQQEDQFVIYRTLRPVTARKPYNVFDATVTKEHWLTRKTVFVRVGYLDLSLFRHPATDCATKKQVRRLLNKWKNHKGLKRHLLLVK